MQKINPKTFTFWQKNCLPCALAVAHTLSSGDSPLPREGRHTKQDYAAYFMNYPTSQATFIVTAKHPAFLRWFTGVDSHALNVVKQNPKLYIMDAQKHQLRIFDMKQENFVADFTRCFIFFKDSNANLSSPNYWAIRYEASTHPAG